MPRFLVIALSLASMLAAFAGLAIGFHNAFPAEVRLPLILATVAPYVLILVFAYAGAWHRAYALAIGTATVAFFGLILFAGVLTLFLGFAMGNTDQVVFVFLLDAFVALQLPLGAAARKARQALPPEARSGGWSVGWALPLAVAIGITAGITGFRDHNARRVDNIYRNEEAARQALNRVAACLKQHAENSAGFPVSLAAVGPTGVKCLDGETAAGKLGGHRLSYWPGAPDAAGKVRLYSLCAEAIDYRKSAWRTYVLDESTQALYLEPNEKMREPYTCSQAWMHDPVRRVKHCAVAYATKNGGYPRTLDDVGSGGTDCLAPSPLETTRISTEGFHAGESVVVYRPAAPDIQDRITAFELHGPGFVNPHRFKVMIDETGAVYAAKDRNAARGDPAPAAFAQQLEGQQAAAISEREAQWKACDGGAAEVCTKLGLSVIDGDSWGSADTYWKRGCEHGSAMSCVFSTRQSDFDVFVLARGDQRDCDAGKPEGCERIKKLARDYRACKGVEPDGCHGLARRIARAGNTHKANTYWDKGCKAGHADSCYFLQVRDFVYVKALQLADACDAGGAAQCAELKRQIAQASLPR